MIDFTHNPIIPADYTSRGRGLPYEASPLAEMLFALRFRRSAMLRIVLASDAAVKPLASQIINNEDHRRDNP